MMEKTGRIRRMQPCYGQNANQFLLESNMLTNPFPGKTKMKIKKEGRRE
jgi:hypothetical protein